MRSWSTDFRQTFACLAIVEKNLHEKQDAAITHATPFGCLHTRPSAAPETNFSPSGEYRTTCTNFSWSDIVVFHLKGGPSKKETALSSLPVTARNGRVGLKSTELIDFVMPEISPTELPASAEKTWPNLEIAVRVRMVHASRIYNTYFSLPSPPTMMR